MQYFYVKKGATLKLPHKSKCLQAPAQEALENNSIPLDRVYCGFIAWEAIQAKQQIGSENVVTLPAQNVSDSILPYRIKAFSDAGDIVAQLSHLGIIHSEQNPTKKLRIALINGTGTMLGDTVVGASNIELAVAHLKHLGVLLEIDVVLAWNARPGSEIIWRRLPCVSHVFDSSLTIKELQSYDAYWDFSHLLQMDGYSTDHFGDFYFNHLGLNPKSIQQKFKVPIIHVSKVDHNETSAIINKFANGRPVVFIQGDASNPARSIPDSFFLRLIRSLTKTLGCKIIVTRELPKQLTNFERRHILNLAEWTKNNLDRYLCAVSLANFIISVDTLALHVAMGCQTPGIGLFSLSDPLTRLKYSPQISGLLLPDANKLAYWNKHKSDESWSTHAVKYENAWQSLSTEPILEKLRLFLQHPE